MEEVKSCREVGRGGVMVCEVMHVYGRCCSEVCAGCIIAETARSAISASLNSAFKSSSDSKFVTENVVQIVKYLIRLIFAYCDLKCS